MRGADYYALRVVLASRKNAGIRVTVLWAAGMDTVTVLVRDDNTSDQFELVVQPEDNPMHVYEHPYARTPPGGVSAIGPRTCDEPNEQVKPVGVVEVGLCGGAECRRSLHRRAGRSARRQGIDEHLVAEIAVRRHEDLPEARRLRRWTASSLLLVWGPAVVSELRRCSPSTRLSAPRSSRPPSTDTPSSCPRLRPYSCSKARARTRRSERSSTIQSGRPSSAIGCHSSTDRFIEQQRHISGSAEQMASHVVAVGRGTAGTELRTWPPALASQQDAVATSRRHMSSTT